MRLVMVWLIFLLMTLVLLGAMTDDFNPWPLAQTFGSWAMAWAGSKKGVSEIKMILMAHMADERATEPHHNRGAP